MKVIFRYLETFSRSPKIFLSKLFIFQGPIYNARMLKPSRSRALDTGRPLPIHKKDDLADLEIQPAMGIQYVFTGR